MKGRVIAQSSQREYYEWRFIRLSVGELIVAMSIPSATFASALGLLVWRFKHHIEKKDKEAEEREKKRQIAAEERDRNYEKIMLMIMQTGRASFVLSKATAIAVQRIPDAKCNGDMTTALEEAEKIQKEEQQFLINAGVAHIFGNEQHNYN